MSTTDIRRVKASEIELKDRLVSVQRVAKVTKGGRTFSFSAIVVVGDEQGIVGYGLGKAKEVSEAIAKGIDDAKKSLIKVPVFKGTIPHEAEGKFGGVWFSSNQHRTVPVSLPVVRCVPFWRAPGLPTSWPNPKVRPTRTTWSRQRWLPSAL